MNDKNITVSKIHETDLTPNVESQIADLIERTYINADFAGRSYYQQRHHFRMVARDGDTLAAHLAVVFKTIALGDVLHDVMGIAEVTTDPQFRRRGLATELVERVCEEATNSSARFLILFGTEQLYKRLGFIPVSNTMTFLKIDRCRTMGVEQTDHHALMVRPVGDTPWDPNAPLDLLGPTF